MSTCIFNVLKFTKQLCGLFIIPNYSLKMPYYAVASGRNQGVFPTWAECEMQVKGFAGAKYKKFNTQAEADSFVSRGGSNFKPSYTNSAPQSTGGSSFNQVRTQLPSSSSSNQPKKFSSLAYIKPPAKSYSTNSKKPSPKEAASCSNDDFQFDNMDDLNEAIMKKMDQLESDIGDIKNKVLKKPLASKKAINPISNSVALKRNAETIPEIDSKRRKVDIKHAGSSHNFEMDDSGYVVVYTDGACSSNGTSKARAGLGVYFGEDHPLNVSEPVSGRATNNCGEIQATTRAIKLARSMGIDKLAIKTDSKFVIDSVTKWISGWKRKGWKLASGGPVKNETDFKELDQALKTLDVKWVHVSAHKGIHGNERADQLAKAGAEKYGK